MLNITIEVVSNKDLVLQIVKSCSPSLPAYNSVEVEQISSTSNRKCIFFGNKRCFTSLPNRILIVCWMFMNNVTNTFPWINVFTASKMNSVKGSLLAKTQFTLFQIITIYFIGTKQWSSGIWQLPVKWFWGSFISSVK